MKNNETKEIWVPAKYIRPDSTVIDFTGLYEVSNLGRVKSLNYRGTGKAGIMSPNIVTVRRAVFHQLALCKNNKQYKLTVHRLVLSSFDFSGYFPNAVADHINARTETSCNDSLCNLHWVTQQQNVSTERHKILQSKAQTNHPAKSKKVKVTNLKTGQVTIYPSAMEAGRSLGINPRQPSECIKNYDGYCKKRQLHFEYVK